MARKVDLKTVVEHYKRSYRARAKAELDSFRAEPSLEMAVCRAALVEEPDGTRYGHQRRRTPDELQRGVRNLVRDVAKLEAAANFGQLIQTIHASVGHLRGLNELYIYDVSLHIGAFKGTLPTRVYLHAGTREGALALGLDAKTRKALDLFEIPEPLRELEPYEIEDVLCIYKAYFAGEVDEPEQKLACPPKQEAQVRDAE
jgi:hypothetical protein